MLPTPVELLHKVWRSLLMPALLLILRPCSPRLDCTNRLTYLDGLKTRETPARRSRSLSPSSASSASAAGTPPPTAKSVSFIPLSPKSSRTLRDLRGPQEGDDETASQQSISSGYGRRPAMCRRRSGSDPSSDGAALQQRKGRLERTPSEDEIEALPDRFDASGRPLGDDGDGRQWASRRGDFKCRPRNRGGSHVQGSWALGGTDAEMVDRMAQEVGNFLQRRQSFMGLLGGVLAGLPGALQDDNRVLEKQR